MGPIRRAVAAIQRSGVANLALSVAERTPWRHRVISTVMDPSSGLAIGSGDMERDWDDRARRNAPFFVAGFDWETPERFARSGYRDLDAIILSGLDIPGDACVLEIGCGLGRLLRPFSERVREAHGVDISSEMVRQASSALSDCPNVQLHHTSGGLEGLPADYFDFCYSYNVFQHISEKEAVLRYIHDAAVVLKSGALFRFQICRAEATSPRARSGGTWLGVRFTEHELRELLPACGLSIVSIVEEGSPANKLRWDSLVVTCRNDPS